MKVAIVHDFFREYGGAERFIASLLGIFPSADIYTLIADREIFKRLGIFEDRIKFDPLTIVPLLNKYLSLSQIAALFLWDRINFRNYDLVISSSSSGLSNLVRTRNVPHIQYIHTPPRNIVYPDEKLRFQLLFHHENLLISRYRNALITSKYILANSHYTQYILKQYFKVNSTVLYPPVKIPKIINSKKIKKYFITVGRLDRIKYIDLAIHACNRLQLQFKIVGIGRELNNLRRIAGPTIEFLGFIDDKKMDSLYQHAIAFLFCAKNEDFGIAPVEAMAHGIPVIAFYGGGTKETIISKKTGLFFYNHSISSLVRTLEKFPRNKFNPLVIYEHSKKFSENRFISEIKKYIYQNLAR